MEIRMLGLQELSLALDLVWEVFEQDVAPCLLYTSRCV